MNHKTRLRRYGSIFWAAIAVIAVSIGSFIYSLYGIENNVEDLGVVTVTTSPEGTSYVNPGTVFPSGPPTFPDPTTPLPTESIE
ncbi:hypothetical protein HN709_02030 [Candidatus Peregrinibacteria bacterium]|jgi:hypothetical protein|nr:hypothetical protein [Candidatus Peregrinibacteria bacterium]MBT7736441.1 hypothetical protein [Candidatus Peregrinibacteria bacterium]